MAHPALHKTADRVKGHAACVVVVSSAFGRAEYGARVVGFPLLEGLQTVLAEFVPRRAFGAFAAHVSTLAVAMRLTDALMRNTHYYTT